MPFSLFERIIASFYEGQFQSWTLLASALKSSLLCCQKLRRTDDYLQKSLMILPESMPVFGVYLLTRAAMGLLPTERRTVFENFLGVLEVHCRY
jgi:hypothetical protein